MDTNSNIHKDGSNSTDNSNDDLYYDDDDKDIGSDDNNNSNNTNSINKQNNYLRGFDSSQSHRLVLKHAAE